ncbi:gamma-glutamyltransferase family protein [Rhodobacteraceae bacterium]|nr:gamma-glutamyltransferase family protein [Paracoccaceae bacterium]
MRNFQKAGRSPVYAANGMVATSHPLAASEALGVLKSGGNAVDAAIAGAVLLGVCEPHMTGLGGDMFALIKPSDSDKVVTINGSGRAPASLNSEALRGEGLTKIEPGHPASITVPGAVDGFCRLSEKFGRLGLEQSLAPAIRYFEEGVPIAPRVAGDIASVAGDMNTSARKHYLNGGRPFALGETFASPSQAEVLRRIVKQGRNAFYDGEVLDDILATLSDIGAGHTAQDFAETEATWGTPISGSYKAFDVLEHRPNGQGATALLLLNILKHFDLPGLDQHSAKRLHIFGEASKLAYDARNRFLADPDHVTKLDHFLSAETADRLAGLIDPNRAMAAPAPLTEEVHKDTVLITVVDRDGMAVSLIYSIFAAFGSCIASDKFGILLQNRGSGFNLTKGHPNEAGPGKRPMHTIIPAMRGKDGNIDMAFGVMGGQYQATGHARLLTNLIDYGMDPQEAVDAPRAFADPIGGTLQVETGFDDGICAQLEAMGHHVTRPANPLGGAQVIMMDRKKGLLIGASDPRKDGAAIGY